MKNEAPSSPGSGTTTGSAPVHIAILGASGYSGAELMRILSRHPRVRIDRVFANTMAGSRVDEAYGWLRASGAQSYEQFSAESVKSSDVVFLALPSGESMQAAKELRAMGKRVIDLSGDFRLKDTTEFTRFYKHEHVASALLPSAVYGLPEWNRAQIARTELLSNPGCYPTSAILPLAPLIAEGLIEPSGIVITSMSGVSGAGRKGSVDLSFSEVNESAKAYKVGSHQHIPEIRSILKELSGKGVSISFVPHLIPVTRGILTTIHAQPKSGVTLQQIGEAFKAHYANEPFVNVQEGLVPELKHVQHTNYIDIGYHLDKESNQVILLSAIDNLVKGAAGQAVQNMNIMMGCSEVEGIQ